MSDAGKKDCPRPKEKGGGLPVFLIIGLPFFVIGLTSQKVFLPIGIAFVLIGLEQMAMKKRGARSQTKADR